MHNRQLTRFEPATNLEEIYLTLSPRPLTTVQEIKAFYRKEMNRVRGGDKVRRLKLGLQRANNSVYHKAIFTGHPGVGKSTELTRLINDEDILKSFRAIRFSVLSDLDPLNFNPLDVVLLMVVEIVEKTHEVTEKHPKNETLRKLKDWYNSEEVTRK